MEINNKSRLASQEAISLIEDELATNGRSELAPNNKFDWRCADEILIEEEYDERDARTSVWARFSFFLQDNSVKIFYRFLKTID